MVDGRVPEAAGGHEWQLLLNKAPSYFENAFGKDVGGLVTSRVFSRSVHRRLLAVRRALENKDARPLNTLVNNIIRHGDQTLD